ncbi:MAG TPA: M23 family metallopeptidase [Symbiobacteriaceae bacterium]|nr:M23 family metallopeptidase [Symbiobacteriaceae bacterium]
MKPTRGLPNAWLTQLPRERRVALGSLAFLVALLGSLILYQRFAAPPSAAEQAPAAPVVQAPTVPPELTEAVSEAAGKAPAVAAPPTSLSRPLAGRRQTLQGYGMAYSELFGDYRLHAGVDYAAGAGESVLAAATGKVTRIDDDPAEGRRLELDHGNGLVTQYAGLGEIKVGLNATVQAGTVIGQVSAADDKPRLHFAVLMNGSPVDPTPYLQH